MNTERSIEAYRLLSALYPKSFRDAYGDDLVATFTEQLRDDRATVVWLLAIRDLVVTLPSQHLEARMHRPAPQTVAMIATAFTVAALMLAFAAGTGPVVGVFLLATIAGLIVSTLAWKAARPAGHDAAMKENRWRTFLAIGLVLFTSVIVVINVPPYNDKELPEAGWAAMMLTLITSVVLITVGLTMGIAKRSARNTNAS